MRALLDQLRKDFANFVTPNVTTWQSGDSTERYLCVYNRQPLKALQLLQFK